MTTREDVLAHLDQAAPELRAHGVKDLWLFGSAARAELKAGSDIDILVDFAVPVTLFGGTTQMVVTWLMHQTGDQMMVAW